MNLSQEQPAGINVPVDLAAALRWVDGDRALLAELIEIFIEDCPPKIQELDQAVKEGNADRVRRAAHSLKGMVAGFDATSAQGLAKEMEDLGTAGDLSNTVRLFSALQLEFTRVIHHLKAANCNE